MDSENTVVRSKKIRIYPKSESKQRLNKYLGLSRYWYNQAIAYLQKDGTKAYLPEVRRIQKEDHPEWAFDCPQRIREHAIADACKSVKNAKQKFKTSGFQSVSFRAKKDPVHRFGFDKTYLNQHFLFKQANYKALFKASELINPEAEGTRIVREDYRWFVIVPQNRVVKLPENQREFIVAIDPGVKTFATFYSATTHGKIGQADFKKITRLCTHMDKLIARMSKAKSKAKQNIKRALQRMRWRIFDLIEDLHKKTAHFLVTHFDYILLPSFQTVSMSQKLHSKVARSMLTFAHYRFNQFLNAKAEEYSAKVIEVQEAYTSMTCSYCGKIAPVGNKSVKKCSCGCVVDRDYNGARGIFLSSCFGGYAPA
jgi:putative transposase